MKTTQISPNIWQLTRLRAFNCFLVREGDGLTLVDASLNGSGAAILKAADQIGQPIKRITLTHAHGDHVGSLDDLAVQLPDVAIMLTQRTADFLNGDIILLPDEPQTPIKGGFVRRITRPTDLLQPDDKVGSLRVVAAPGHSPDHIAFFDERDGTLLGGDAFQTQGGIAVAGMLRWLFPFPAMASWHLPTALASARALLALQPGRLAVGHGKALENPVPLMKQAIQRAETAVNG